MKRLKYLLLFLFILVIEILIALYIKSGFIRENIGDILVIPCIYMLLKTIFLDKIKYLELYVLLLGIIVELLQLFNITNLLSFNNKIISVMLGGTFDIKDIICYIIGYLIIVILKERVIK